MKGWALPLACYVLSSPVWAQTTTNIPDKVKQALEMYGPVAVTRIVAVPRSETHCNASIASRGGAIPGGNCFTKTVYDQKPQQFMEVLTATNIRIVNNSPIQFGQLAQKELVDQLIVKEGLVQNCGTMTQNSTQVTLTETFQRSTSVQVTKSVTNTTSDSMNFTLNLSKAFKIGGTLTIGQSETNGTSNTVGSSDTNTNSGTATIQNLPPQKAEVVIMQVYPTQFAVPFSATVTAEADLSKNDAGKTLLSQILDPESRTFQIEGVIQAVDASDSVTLYADVAYDQHRCDAAAIANGILVVTPFVPTTPLTAKSPNQN